MDFICVRTQLTYICYKLHWIWERKKWMNLCILLNTYNQSSILNSTRWLSCRSVYFLIPMHSIHWNFQRMHMMLFHEKKIFVLCWLHSIWAKKIPGSLLQLMKLINGNHIIAQHYVFFIQTLKSAFSAKLFDYERITLLIECNPC